jgi:hypothetical protein
MGGKRLESFAASAIGGASSNDGPQPAKQNPKQIWLKLPRRHTNPSSASIHGWLT